MKTEIYHGCIGDTAKIIRNGGIVGIPTETVYGLAGNGLNREAVSRIYEVKGRPEIKPLALMIPDSNEINKYCLNVPEQAKALADRFWPGPLSIVLKARKDIVPEIVRAGGETVSLRCPDSPLTLELLKEAQVPFAAPSANPSGEKSPKTAEKVAEYFNGKIDAIVDGGECMLGIESTIIDMSGIPYRILRQGALSEEAIRKELSGGIDIIGITGGTGSGKTTVLESLLEQGAMIIDCDALYHELLDSSIQMNRELASEFPEAIVNGKTDRKKLGKIVFSDKKKLARLNEITHKYIADEIENRINAFAMCGGKTVGLDAVELISSGLGEKCRIVVGIIAPLKIRLQRIMERDGISEQDALQRIRAQHSDDYYRKNCNCILENNSEIQEIKKRFLSVIKGE